MSSGKPQKARRKISLPWFRQGSVNPPHQPLTRQHTIDTPGAFTARMSRQQAGGSTVEMTWVIADHVATPGSQELTVHKGQQVEVLEVTSSTPDMCLVRMPTSGVSVETTPEGLVPLAVLKQPPKTSPARRAAADHDSSEPGTSDGSAGTVTTSSPVNKKRVFSGRKWLPPPLRKLSQGKVEKGAASSAPDRPAPKKTGSADKRYKLPVAEMGNKQTGASEDDVPPTPRAPLPYVENGEEGEEEVELPPPMKPITEPLLGAGAGTDEAQGKRSSSLSLKALEGATSADLAEIEQIVKERMEQHTENQERNSLLNRDSKLSSDFHSTGDEEGDGPEAAEEADKGGGGRVDAVHKREYVIRELVETERDYVKDLGLVVEGYIPLMRDPDCDVPMPEDLRNGKDKMVFGNLEAMYEWHRDSFLKALERCILQPQELGPLFKRYERKLHMYVVYCQNKPVSEYIMSEYETYFEELRQKLGHKLQLCDLLIKPVQRIMKYQLLLRDVFKYTERAELTSEADALRQALHVMHVVPKSANDMMDVGRLQGFDGKITAQGKLLLHGPLSCCEGFSTFNFKGKELQVFLFEQNIIFSEAVGKKTQFSNPVYIHKAHIQVNKMSLEETADESDSCKFIIRSTDPRKPSLAYVCQAASRENRDEWVSTIRNILQTQKDFLKAIQSPIAYQKELTKDVSAPDLHSAWNPSMRKAYSQPPPTPTSHWSPKSSSATLPHHPSLAADRDAFANGGDKSRTDSPTKNRPSLFEGFRNTLRARSRNDTPDSNDKNITRRWSEAGVAHVCDSPSPPTSVGVGAVVKATADFRSSELSINRGDPVQVWALDVMRGYFVRHHSSEGWVPSHVLHQPSDNGRKPWAFRFRKPSFSGSGTRRERRSFDGAIASPVGNNANKRGLIPEYPSPPPEFVERLSDISAPAGTTAELRCRVQPAGDVDVTWRKASGFHDATGEVIGSEGRYKVSLTSEGEASLIVDGCRPADSGQYTCTACNDTGNQTTAACLTVVGSTYGIPTQPCVQVLAGTSVLLTWEATGEFLIECCLHRSGEWHPVGGSATVRGPSHVVDGLTPGETYGFRLATPGGQVLGPSSAPVTIQVTDTGRWQQEQFRSRYSEHEELGRGRVALVVRARDRGTGQDVAAKQVSRRKQGHYVTRAEYTVLSRLQHPGIPRALALFNNAPAPGIDTIVMELVSGPYLFSYVCRDEDYNERIVCSYMQQLVSSLAYLHDQSIAHLDIKPENVLVELGGECPVLKLVDFGDALGVREAELVLPPANLEFAAPELVLGQPASCRADMWSAGVFLYAFLSGLSPFLDDSLEETTTNILKCDYCFPQEYFSNISSEGKDLISQLLVISPSQRVDAHTCLDFPWFKHMHKAPTIPTSRLSSFMERRQSLVRPMFATTASHQV